MLFNSIDFAIFLPIVFLLYWFVTNKRLKLQNTLIVGASYLFYGWWDWRFLILIFISTLVDYAVSIGLNITNKPLKRRLLLITSLSVNLGFLLFFKYFNFFVDNFIMAFSFFGHKLNATTLNIILPVGISFYTFQTLSYTIDVYKKKLEPTRDIIAFSAFVSFFPQLVAGPIERASNLLPQFYVKRYFEYSKAVDGLRQILWGLFKKIVIADSCAVFVDQIFSNSANLSGSTLVLGAFFFTIQVYCDFSGYSDIAIGTARLFGFNLKRNFAFPFFSRNIAEFWRRWHISLTTWFRDYLYIPLGGSRVSQWKVVRNVIIIFVVCGFWHGARWNYVIWGAMHAVYFLPLLFFNANRKYTEIIAQGKMLPTLREFTGMFVTFSLLAFSLIVFRTDSMSHAWAYISEIFSSSLFTIPFFYGRKQALLIMVIVLIFLFIEWIGREEEHALASLEKIKYSAVRRFAYYMVSISILLFGSFNENPFIYFQF